MALQVQNLLFPSRAKSQPVADGNTPQFGPRSGRYLEQIMQNVTPTKHNLADEGSYFTATNPTLGTAIALPVNATFAATSANFVIQNTDGTAPTAKRVYLDYMKLIHTVAAASTTITRFAVVLDNINRAPTAGLALLVPNNTNIDDATGSIAKVWSSTGGSMLTVPAAGAAARQVSTGAMGGLPIVGDETIVQFGAVDVAPYGSSATASRKASIAPPVVIGPQQYAIIYVWFTSNAATGASYEFELAWWER